MKKRLITAILVTAGVLLLLLICAAVIVGWRYAINRDAINAVGWSPVGYTYGLADAGVRNNNDFDIFIHSH